MNTVEYARIETDEMKTSTPARVVSVLFALSFMAIAMAAGYWEIGWPPVLIVGGSGIVGSLLWWKTYLRRPLDPNVVLPPFLLTVAALEVHMIEEYLTHFGPAMSRLFNISWSERSFLMIFAFIGPAIYSLTALGLFRKVPIAGFFMCFIFIGPGVAEFVHFILPALRPDVAPLLAQNISGTVGSGRFITEMPNYYFGATGRYYFSGMYTAILPMIPGIYGVTRLLKAPRDVAKKGDV
jgi:hypothetical protein